MTCTCGLVGFYGILPKNFHNFVEFARGKSLAHAMLAPCKFRKIFKTNQKSSFQSSFFDFQTSLVEQTDLVELFSELLWRFLLILSFFSFFHFYNFSFSFITSVTSQKKQNLVNYLIIDL